MISGHCLASTLIVASTLEIGSSSARILGVTLLAFLAALYFLIFRILQRRVRSAKQQVAPATKLPIKQGTRRLRFAVAIMPVLLIVGLWITRGQPWAPRIVGAVANVFLTLWLISVIRRAEKNYRSK
jgi:hypothetical protein